MSPSPSPRSRAAASACLMLALGACSDAPAPAPDAAAHAPSTAEMTAASDGRGAADVPTQVTGLDGGAVRMFLVDQYGELAQLVGDWPGVPRADGLGTAPALREVCARGAIGTPDAPAELVAVCGVPDGAGHVTSALIDLFLLFEDGDAVIAASRAHLDTFGSSGDVADVSVRRFGPRLHGVVIEDGFTGQGITVGTTHLVLPEGDGFRLAGTLRSSLDNLGATLACSERADCAPDTAFDLIFDLAIDDRVATAGAWPLRVRERGEACGRRVDRTYQVPFDAGSGMWAIPPALAREGCE
ncbi:hypothetical protein ACF3M1_14455 [Luteimonas sp. WGS1318]|uniref:hypothetical protein n=1 Tax=Luteimonas sp. WGS1318 TaxID=3366815 RepID=UPI00372D5B57